ncbi:MAG: CinA family protein [Janthinobacterium lividum]
MKPTFDPSTCQTLIKLFLQYKLKLALAESCTCGLVAAQLAPAEGVSDVLLGSVVTYHALAKQRLLGVRASTLELYSAESQQTTNEMVLGLHEHLPEADVGVAVTGLCGPGPSATPDKPVGTVFVTILVDGHAHEYRVLFKGDADAMRQQAAAYIYEQLTELLQRLQPIAQRAAPAKGAK